MRERDSRVCEKNREGKKKKGNAPAACHKYLITVGAGRAPVPPCRSSNSHSAAESVSSGSLASSAPHLCAVKEKLKSISE